MNPPFIARTHDLLLLDQLWDAPGAQMLVLYGRRHREDFAVHTLDQNRHQLNALYWVASPTSALAQLRPFTGVYNFANPRRRRRRLFPTLPGSRPGSRWLNWRARSGWRCLSTSSLICWRSRRASPAIAEFLGQHARTGQSFSGFVRFAHGDDETRVYSYPAPLYGPLQPVSTPATICFGATTSSFPTFPPPNG